MRAAVFLISFIALFGFAADGSAQAARFDVISIKPSAVRDGGFSEDITDGGELSARNLTVWNLLRLAYDLRDLQITGGPAWITSQGFDIQAKPPQTGAAVSRAQTQERVQRLLADRFKLKFHRETRDGPAYALTIATRGPKLPPPREGRGPTRMGDLDAPSMTIASLCQILEFEVGWPVINRTGIEGPYAIQLHWASDRVGAGADITKPSLFTALQEQLGLKLDPARAPVEMFVVDRIELPSEN